MNSENTFNKINIPLNEVWKIISTAKQCEPANVNEDTKFPIRTGEEYYLDDVQYKEHIIKNENGFYSVSIGYTPSYGYDLGETDATKVELQIIQKYSFVPVKEPIGDTK